MPLGLRLLIAYTLLLGLAGCSSLSPRDPLEITLVGIEPLASQGLEMRFAIELRVQNPNAQAINFDGIALSLEINGQPLASGVSDQKGHVPRFGETLIKVPLSISALSVVRQTWGIAAHSPGQGVPYVLRGKLAEGWLGSRRFSDEGVLKWPPSRP